MNNPAKLLHFTKMHGLGNDFVIINALIEPVHNNIPIPLLADRHRGIGFDQLLVIESSKNADFFCRIYNADGSEAAQCGNGLRCIARFLHEQKLHAQSMLKIETKAGIYSLTIHDYEHIHMTMGIPTIQEPLLTLEFSEQKSNLALSILSMGNPHAILNVTNIDAISSTLGPTIAAHPYFIHGVNVGFMQVMDKHSIRLRTYERGSGETFACGSNACAAVVAGIANGWLHSKVTVHAHYGSLEIEWQGGSNDPVHMVGPATLVYAGEIALVG